MAVTDAREWVGSTQHLEYLRIHEGHARYTYVRVGADYFTDGQAAVVLHMESGATEPGVDEAGKPVMVPVDSRHDGDHQAHGHTVWTTAAKVDAFMESVRAEGFRPREEDNNVGAFLSDHY